MTMIMEDRLALLGSINAASSIARVDRGWTNHIGVKNVHSDRQRSSAELNELGARPRSVERRRSGSRLRAVPLVGLRVFGAD